MEKKKLHSGCGKIIKEEWVNLDMSKAPGVDIVHNLDKYPYPFKDNTFEEIYMAHVLEHLTDTEKTLEKRYRISKPNGIVQIVFPHHASGNGYADKTPKRFFNATLFTNTITQGGQNIRLNKNNFNFEMASLKVTMGRRFKLFERLMNKNLGFYDYPLCYLIRPDELQVRLRVKE